MRKVDPPRFHGVLHAWPAAKTWRSESKKLVSLHTSLWGYFVSLTGIREPGEIEQRRKEATRSMHQLFEAVRAS